MGRQPTVFKELTKSVMGQGGRTAGYYKHGRVRRGQKTFFSQPNACIWHLLLKKRQEFLIRPARIRNLSTGVTNPCGLRYNPLSRLLFKQLLLGKTRRHLFRRHPAFSLVLSSWKVPQFVPRPPLTPRSDCEKDTVSTWLCLKFVLFLKSFGILSDMKQMPSFMRKTQG